ncbi:MAG: hypothetical protein WC144_04830 [Sulfurimonas sp.]|nr:hypothetical protein [Sulfurimonadaceae bacterium]
MKQSSYELFEKASLDEILKVLADELVKRNESPIWREKVVPFAEAVLSVLVPLRDSDMLFDPQGERKATLTHELFFEWCDMVSLKSLAFTLQKSNSAKKLVRTKLSEDVAQRYQPLNLEKLGAYLAKNSVNLEDEFLDFPIATYNLHQGVANVIRSLL